MDDPRVTIHSLARRNIGPVQPVKAVPAYVAAAMRPEEAFRATLSDCLAQITANAATLRVGRSVEGLHQLRVAFRRLEVALDTCQTEGACTDETALAEAAEAAVEAAAEGAEPPSNPS